jgi:hypothetical protein
MRRSLTQIAGCRIVAVGVLSRILPDPAKCSTAGERTRRVARVGKRLSRGMKDVMSRET